MRRSAQLLVSLLLVLGQSVAPAVSSAREGTKLSSVKVPPLGFVPDAATAVSIAKAVALPIYGDEVISEQEPLVATKRDGLWTVQGTLPPGYLGGVLKVVLDSRDSRILSVSHGK
jgi:hypothetical protein